MSTAWRPVLVQDTAATALAVARDVAGRLREQRQVEAAVAAAARQGNQILHWRSDSIAQGYAGLAVLCGYLATCLPGESWDVAGHRYLALAAHAAEERVRLEASLFSGLSGVAFAAWSLSQQGTRYRRLLSSLEEALLPPVGALAAAVSHTVRGLPASQFDVISGLSGITAYLLCRRDQAGPAAVLRRVLRALISLTCDADEGLPRWFTPPRFVDEARRPHYPHGNLNCGLAHGLPGLLCALALARLAGVTVDGLDEAIARAANWLAEHRLDDRWGVNWPTAIPLVATAGPSTQLRVASADTIPFGQSRTAWCYGSPGVARAIWLAGEALDHQGYRDLAVDAMAAVYRRPLAQRRIDSPTFCHGVAGLLAITLRFAHDTGRTVFTRAARDLVAQLLALYEPGTLLGYRAIEADQRVDQPGLLDGAPGVALVLLAAATDAAPAWDRLFLLA